MADPMKFTLKVEGNEQLARAFRLMSNQIDDWHQMWPSISEVFYNMERARFASAGFGTWRRLSDGYASWKHKHYPGEPIMSLTGNLRRSLTYRFGANAVYLEEARALTMGTTIPYAYAHQEGYAPRNLPARPLIDLQPEDFNVMARIALEGFDRYAEQLGFQTTKD
jgi:phage gpG-like protein